MKLKVIWGLGIMMEKRDRGWGRGVRERKIGLKRDVMWFWFSVKGGEEQWDWVTGKKTWIFRLT